MGGLDFFGDDDSGTVFRDTIMLALAGFVSVVILLLPFINPQAKQAADDAKAPGNVIVEIQWLDSLDADVDLWVQAPGDVPVGYSNKGGRVFNLLRDDLGKMSDISDLNYEVSYSRGIPPGEYTVDVHMYRGQGIAYPVAVKVVVSTKPTPTAGTVPILATTVQLKREGQELTALRFRLDGHGQLVPGSVTNLYRALRSASTANSG